VLGRPRTRIPTRRSSASRDQGASRPRRRKRRSSTVRASSRSEDRSPSGLWAGGDHGTGTQKDVGDQSVPRHHGLPGARLAAGAWFGHGIPADIHDPVHPVRLDDVSDKNFAYMASRRSTTTGRVILPTSGAAARVHAAARPIR